jgi:hypothetical protein
VKTLDQFDSLVNELSIGFPAEMLARKEQYKHFFLFLQKLDKSQ